MPTLLHAVHLAATAAVVSAVRRPIFPPANVSAGQLALTNANASAQANRSAGSPPCQCEAFNSQWKKPAKRAPACLFMDLGAADGETYRAFLHQSKKWSFNYDSGPFKHEECYAYLVEANPKFIQDLELLRTGKVFPMTVTAAYMCDKRSEKFYLDVTGPGGWGSSLDEKHAAVASTKQEVNVNLYNLMRLLEENAIPEDTVVVKMDIEGAEYDILPCLADSPAASLIDTLYLEDHCPGQWWCPTTGQAGNSKETFNKALAKLRSRGVNIPAGYWSPMF
mmetsp:Transcript_88327/g.205495  ORF Transcript_88327/g.205495 Transcript_88327/m.205495 type:complete len:279 (-) Transcript_88327:78-914(-)